MLMFISGSLLDRRKQRYQSAPRNIHRHVLMSEIKEATATLPLVRDNFPKPHLQAVRMQYSKHALFYPFSTNAV